MPSATPFSPSATRSTSGASGSIVMTTSLAAATSFGVAAACAPASTSAFTACGCVSYTTSRWPFLITLRAMGPPIVPNPMQPTSIAEPLLGAFFPGLQIPHRRAAQVLRVLGLECGRVRLAPRLVVSGLDGRCSLRERALHLIPFERLGNELPVDHVFRCLEQRRGVALR